VSYTDVFAYAPKPDPNATVAARYFYEWLPNLGVRQQLSNEWSLNASYSRKTGRPDWGPQASSFTGAEAAFLKEGMNMQSVMNKIQPELVDEVDVGARYQAGKLTVVPTFFGFWTHKKEVLVYDPNVGQNYYQSNAATTGYGFELEAIWKATDYLTVNGTFTDAAEVYDSNISTGTNTTMYIWRQASALYAQDSSEGRDYLSRLRLRIHADHSLCQHALRTRRRLAGG